MSLGSLNPINESGSRDLNAQLLGMAQAEDAPPTAVPATPLMAPSAIDSRASVASRRVAFGETETGSSSATQVRIITPAERSRLSVSRLGAASVDKKDSDSKDTGSLPRSGGIDIAQMTAALEHAKAKTKQIEYRNLDLGFGIISLPFLDGRPVEFNTVSCPGFMGRVLSVPVQGFGQMPVLMPSPTVSLPRARMGDSEDGASAPAPSQAEGSKAQHEPEIR